MSLAALLSTTRPLVHFTGVVVPMSSLPVEITHVSAVVKGVVSQNISVPPPTNPQCRRTTKHIARTFLVTQSSRTCPRGCAALHPSSLRFAPSSLRLTGRGSAAASLLQTRSAHHDRAVAPRRLLSPAPLSLKTVCCAAAAGPRALTADPVAGGRVHGISPIHRRCA